MTIVWDHSSENFDGYYIERNGQRIDTLSSTERKYVDGNGIPGNTNEYSIITFVKREGEEYESVPVVKSAHFPTIPTMSAFAFPNSDLGSVDFAWFDTFLPPQTEGFRIYRRDETSDWGDPIATLGRNEMSYQDFTGVPGVVYQYDLRVVVSADQVLYESAPKIKECPDIIPDCVLGPTYPNVPTPENFLASDDKDNHVELTWLYDTLIFNDGFYVYDGDDNKIATVPVGKRKYNDIVNNVLPEGPYTYKIRAYKILDGNEYLSDPISVSDANTVATVGNVTTFTASDGEFSTKVILSWEEETTSIGDLKIYRDAVHIASVPASYDVYIDTEGIPGKEYIYVLKDENDLSIADLGSKKSQR